MQLGLFMMVRDEAQTIKGCLSDILDLFDDAVIVDTGSTDGTPDLLRSLGVEPVFDELDAGRCYSHADVRNRGFSRLRSPWIFSLDADERVDRGSLEKIVRGQPPTEAGWLCKWTTTRSDGTCFEDYKCSLFRRGVTKQGLIHDNVQVDLRRRGLRATWHEDLEIRHLPEGNKADAKRQFYLERLECATRLDPSWYRYHWFAGYTHFRSGNIGAAVSYLRTAADSQSPAFPVECLNANMVLADLYARVGDHALVRLSLQRAAAFYREVAEDFEVRVNFRVSSWLDQACRALSIGDWDSIRSYEFAC
jgi:glycosyltransferase involved in cell wall biosynthesis